MKSSQNREETQHSHDRGDLSSKFSILTINLTLINWSRLRYSATRIQLREKRIRDTVDMLRADYLRISWSMALLSIIDERYDETRLNASHSSTTSLVCNHSLRANTPFNHKPCPPFDLSTFKQIEGIPYCHFCLIVPNRLTFSRSAGNEIQTSLYNLYVLLLPLLNVAQSVYLNKA